MPGLKWMIPGPRIVMYGSAYWTTSPMSTKTRPFTFAIASPISWQSRAGCTGEVGARSSGSISRCHSSRSACRLEVQPSHCGPMAGSLELEQQLLEEDARVAGDADLDRVVAPDLGDVQVDLDDLRPRDVVELPRCASSTCGCR